MHDVLIIGGGVVGLSLAYELARRGQSVQVVERGKLGQEASGAAAGIFPPARWDSPAPAWERLRGLSHELHQEWSARLLQDTGIDNGLRICGGLHLARRAGEAAALAAAAEQLASDGVRVEVLTPQQLAELEPALRPLVKNSQVAAACLLPDESQINSPRHLQALAAACQAIGVDLVEQVSVESISVAGDAIASVSTSQGELTAASCCLAAGAWSETVGRHLGLPLSVYPIRGQLVSYHLPASTKPSRIINEGPRYLVPRADGLLLVGSTEEDVGFDKRTTDEAIAELCQFAAEIVPQVQDVPPQASWAGLRPQSVDGFPYLGRAPHLGNAFVATGHYRSGLHLSTGTALLMADMIIGNTPSLDMAAFRLDR